MPLAGSASPLARVDIRLGRKVAYKAVPSAIVMMTAWKKGLRMRLLVSCLVDGPARRAWVRGRGRPFGDCRILRYLRFGSGLQSHIPVVTWRSTARIIHREVNMILAIA